MFHQALEPAYPYPSYVQAHEVLAAAFGVEEYFSRRRNVLVVTGEPLGASMAGPAIRAVEIARCLADEHDVTLATLGSCDLGSETFTITGAVGHALRTLVERADLIVFQGLLLTHYPWIADASAALVADIYDPFHLETLEQERARPMGDRLEISDATVTALNLQLTRADFFLCASEKQRDFWLGQLAGQGRVNPFTYDQDQSLRDLIDVAPFGIPEGAAKQHRHGLRGTIPGIGMTDKVVLWGGGVYNWFDPLTLISAIDLMRAEVPDVRLVFMGMKHPNPGVPAMEMAQRARELSAALGLTGSHVFFNESWVPYEERADVLLDADIGVSCHFDHVETEFSFRTRILDYLWAGLPIVCTQGDAFGDLVDRERLGTAVPPEDPPVWLLRSSPSSSTSRSVRRLEDACARWPRSSAGRSHWRPCQGSRVILGGRPISTEGVERSSRDPFERPVLARPSGCAMTSVWLANTSREAASANCSGGPGAG